MIQIRCWQVYCITGLVEDLDGVIGFLRSPL